MRRKSTCRSAFTFVELAIAAVVVAILTVAAWPDKSSNDQAKLDSAVSRLQSDIDYARTVSLISPSDPSVIKVSLDNDKYWIAKQSAPDTPITNPDTKQPYVVQMGPSGDSTVRDVNITADNFGANHTLTFDSSGGLRVDGSVGMEFQLGSMKESLKIAPAAASTQKTNGDLASTGVSNIVGDGTTTVGSGG